MLDKQAMGFLKALVACRAPSGFEQDGQRLMARHLALAGVACAFDVHGNLHAVLNEGAPTKVMLEAHCDEIGFLVSYIDEQGGHHYLYVKDAVINRADVGENGVATVQRIARNVSGATLMFLDDTSDPDYGYVYFNRTSGSGLSVERAVYNGDAEDYRTLAAENEDHAPYKSVQVLDIQHASSWYNYEVVDGVVFYANAAAYGENSYTYVWAADLTKANGSAMNNAEIAELNEKYDAITDDTDGYLAKLSEEGNGKLSGVIEYYFYTGERSAIDENIAESIENGKSETYLYSEESGTLYTTVSYFTIRLGDMSESDQESFHDYWRSVLQRYTVEDETTGLPAWAWALIGVGIGIVVAAAVVVPIVVVKKRRKAQDALPREERMAVDTTDDKDVDVYAVNDAPAQETAEQAETVPEPAEEPTEEPVSEVPAEETEESAAEAPAEQAAEPEEAAPESEQDE